MFSTKLKDLRRQAKMSQEKMAEKQNGKPERECRT